MRRAAATAAAVALLALSSSAAADSAKIGLLMGFTGPLTSVAEGIAQAAEIAVDEINASGAFLGGRKLETVAADTGCLDVSATTASVERLIDGEGVSAIVGALCSTATLVSARSGAIPAGVVMISPSSTSPAITGLDDDGVIFRTTSSDARAGAVLARILRDKGIETVALSYTDSDYGRGYAAAFGASFTDMGGTVARSAGHEDGKADYAAEVAALAATDADHLVVLGYLDQGGQGIIRASIEAGAFSSFSGGGGMIGQSLIDALGEGIDGMIGIHAGNSGDGARAFAALGRVAGLAPAPNRGEAYDAAAIIALAMQAAGSTERAAVRERIVSVANAPGEKIVPGQLAEALGIIAAGGDVNYEGASSVEFDAAGDTPGGYLEVIVEDGAWRTVGTH